MSSNGSNGKKVSLAAFGSLALHFLVLFLWAMTAGRLAAPKPPPPTPPPIHLQIVKAQETPPPQAATPTPTPIPYLDTLSRLMAEHPPEHPKFESARDTEAASELPATGDQAMPTQEGRKNPPVFAFNTTRYVPGETPGAAPAPPPATEPPAPQPAATLVTTALATPRPTPSHTPVPDDEFGLATPTPTPEDADPSVDPAAFRSPDATMPPRPSVASRSDNQSNAVGFQPAQDAASVSGSITKHGAASVDSAATPVGRYQSRVLRAITSKWYDYYYSRSDIISLGMVRIHITVDRRGKVVTPRVVSNSSNEALASVSLQALQDAPIPPMPPEAMSALPGGELSMDLSFNSE